MILSVNWGVYIWGVNNEHVVETSLGYFINPIVTVLLGVVVLHERLRRAQWAALGLGTVAVVVLTAGYGRPPWIAIESLGVETAAVFLPALVYLSYLQATGTSTFASQSAGHAVLLAGAGLVTVLPLLAFRCIGDPRAAEHTRAAAIPRTGAAALRRRGRVRRADAAGAPDRLRVGVDRARGAERGCSTARPPAYRAPAVATPAEGAARA